MQLVLKIIGLVLKFAPLIIQVVREVEVLLSGRPGAEKLEAAMRLIKAALVARGIAFTDEMQKIVRGLIELIVGALDMFKAWKTQKTVSTLVKENRVPADAQIPM